MSIVAFVWQQCYGLLQKQKKPTKETKTPKLFSNFFYLGEFSLKSGFYNLNYESCKLSENYIPLSRNAVENFL